MNRPSDEPGRPELSIVVPVYNEEPVIAELDKRLRATLSSLGMTWEAIFVDTDACVTPVLSPREAAEHPLNVARAVFEVDGTVQPAPAPRFSKTPGAIGDPPGLAGSGTRAGLARWGMASADVEAFRLAGAFGAPPAPAVDETA